LKSNLLLQFNPKAITFSSLLGMADSLNDFVCDELTVIGSVPKELTLATTANGSGWYWRKSIRNFPEMFSMQMVTGKQ
jgi:hypothetical protein